MKNVLHWCYKLFLYSIDTVIVLIPINCKIVKSFHYRIDDSKILNSIIYISYSRVHNEKYNLFDFVTIMSHIWQVLVI